MLVTLNMEKETLFKKNSFNTVLLHAVEAGKLFFIEIKKKIVDKIGDIYLMVSKTVKSHAQKHLVPEQAFVDQTKA